MTVCLPAMSFSLKTIANLHANRLVVKFQRSRTESATENILSFVSWYKYLLGPSDAFLGL